LGTINIKGQTLDSIPKSTYNVMSLNWLYSVLLAFNSHFFNPSGRLFIMRWTILLIVLLCGCLTQQTIKEKYICQDGSISDTASACASRTIECPKCVSPAVKTTTLPTPVVQPQIANANSNDECVAIGCPVGTKFVSSKTSDKYHICACQFAIKLSAKNRVCYTNVQEAEAAGKKPCGICIGKI
jgi:hypothetical protein